MSARIAPEPISIGVTFNAQYAQSAAESTRPIEATEPTNANKQDNPSNSGAGAHARFEPPQPSERPPGVDPSVPPQALKDAELIAEEFRASLVAQELEAKAAEENAAPTAQSAPVSENDPAQQANTTNEVKEDTSRADDIKQRAEEARASRAQNTQPRQPVDQTA